MCYILLKGKGFPDVNTRMLLRRLWDMFSIPIIALVDADPHGEPHVLELCCFE